MKFDSAKRTLNARKRKYDEQEDKEKVVHIEIAKQKKKKPKTEETKKTNLATTHQKLQQRIEEAKNIAAAAVPFLQPVTVRQNTDAARSYSRKS
jgi:hypothetical protein